MRLSLFASLILTSFVQFNQAFGQEPATCYRLDIITVGDGGIHYLPPLFKHPPEE